MELRINNETIPYTLEEEHSLYDVIRSLSEWLSGSGFSLVSASTEAGSVDLSDSAALRDIAIQGLGFLSVYAEPDEDLLIERLSTIYQLFGLIEQAVRKRKTENAAELAAEYRSIRAGISGLLDGEGIWNGGEGFDELLTRYLASPSDTAAQEELLSFLGKILSLLAERIREASNPVQETAKTAALCSAMLPRITEISVLLQTGKDREAMDRFILFTETIGKLFRTIPNLRSRYPHLFPPEGDGFSGSIQELNHFFSELVNAFTLHDTVLIGDLIEYEIVPRISAFLSRILTVLESEGASA